MCVCTCTYGKESHIQIIALHTGTVGCSCIKCPAQAYTLRACGAPAWIIVQSKELRRSGLCRLCCLCACRAFYVAATAPSPRGIEIRLPSRPDCRGHCPAAQPRATIGRGKHSNRQTRRACHYSVAVTVNHGDLSTWRQVLPVFRSGWEAQSKVTDTCSLIQDKFYYVYASAKSSWPHALQCCLEFTTNRFARPPGFLPCLHYPQPRRSLGMQDTWPAPSLTEETGDIRRRQQHGLCCTNCNMSQEL